MGFIGMLLPETDPGETKTIHKIKSGNKNLKTIVDEYPNLKVLKPQRAL